MTRYGVPTRITTDQGRQFKAELFQQLMQLTGTTHLRTTAYHSEANGMIERLHRQIKAAIRCHETEVWTTVLPIIMMEIRAAWKEDLKATSAELVFGEPIKLPGQFIEERVTSTPESVVGKLRKMMQELRPTLRRHGRKTTFVFKDMETTKEVFVRQDMLTKALQSPYEGPYEVISRGDKIFKIRVNGKTVAVAIDRLKPAYSLADDEEPRQDSIRKDITTRSGRAVKPPVRFKL